MSQDRFTAALAGQVLGAAAARAEMLTSIVETARSIFVAEAASIALLDEPASQFVFEAVAGRGADTLVGSRFTAGEGLAGAVAQNGEPLIVDDLIRDRRFARDVAEDTGYVPSAMMVAPLLRDERTLGVLSVLDRGATGRTGLQELQLLVTFADQAALALDLTAAARRAAATLEAADEELAQIARLARRLQALSPERRAAGARLLAALEELLDR